MSKAFKLGVVTLVAVMAFGVVAPRASAQTTADLQAQIAALLAQIQALQAQLAGQPAASASYNFSRDLTVGSTGDDVKQLQQFLNGKGYLVAESGAGSLGNESTYFGNLTKAALAKYQAAVGISPAVGYFGPITRSYVNSLAVPPGPGPVVPPVGSGLVLSLASDNPVGGAIPKGAAGVPFLKFNVAGSGTVDSLVFKRLGIGATADFSSAGIYLYDGNTRLTSGRSINSTTHEITFLNLGIAVSGSKALALVADVATSSTTGNRHWFELVSASGNPAPSGSLKGSEFQIAGQTVGSITATSGAAPTNPKVGQAGAKIAEFKLSAGSTEDVEVVRLALTEGGSISNSNLSNFVLKQGGNTLATASAVGAKDLISFQFSSPFLLEKGQERTFEVYADIAGATRSDDTIVLYFDSKSDINATGKVYGYPVNPNISALDATSDGDTLTVAGGDVTITFNGPIAGDIARRGQDVSVYDFTVASKNNVEIRNLRFTLAYSGITDDDGFADFKLWDVDANAVIASAIDIASTTSHVFTDVINISAGQTKHFKATVDVDADADDNDSITVTLAVFTLGDIRNLDNNTNVALATIVPNAAVAGNAQTVKVPTLDVQLAASPASQTYVKGLTNADVAGFSFRAIADNIRLNSVTITATSSSGTLTSGEVTSLALYDGATRVSDVKSLDTTALTATFDNLNLTINKGDTKVLTLRGNIATDITNGDVFYMYVNTLASNVVAYDRDGNSATLSGVTANSGGTVSHTIAANGDVTVARAADDVDSEAGIVVAGGERVLGKFRFTSANEGMTINKMQILVNNSTGATATTSAAADEAPLVKLYDGATQVGATAGYSVTFSGDNSGVVFVENLGWAIGKDVSKTLTVKGNLNSISGGADSGASVYVHVMAAGFEAQGATAKDTTITAASGNEKVVFKTKPTVSVAAGDTALTNGLKNVMKFTVLADSAEQVAWKKVQLEVSMTSATMSAASANPGTTGSVQIKKVSSGAMLNIASAFSGATAPASTTVAVTGGNTGYVAMILNTEEVVAAGGSEQYEVYLTFADVPSTSASAVVKLHKAETTLVAATLQTTVENSDSFGVRNGSPSFIWSDYSTVGHVESTATDWANGVYVKTLPSSSFTLSKS